MVAGMHDAGVGPHAAHRQGKAPAPAHRVPRRAGAWLVLFPWWCGCAEPGDAITRAQSPQIEPNAPTQTSVVDSALTPAEELRRFHDTIGPAVERLGAAAAPSRDALVERYVNALAASDTATMHDLRINAREFGYLYYPHTRYTRPPYRMSPSLLWFMITQNSEKGTLRALRRYGGSGLRLKGYRCDASPRQEGPNRLWTGCAVELHRPGAGAETRALFGAILERDGRFKFVTLANDL